MSDNKRRLPVYILLDRLAMSLGDHTHAAWGAVIDLLRQLGCGLHGLPPERIWASVIAFDGSARQLRPLAPVRDLARPLPGGDRLATTSAGPAALGEALRLVHECICREVRGPSGEWPGDWTPLVILVSDGQAGDGWQDAACRLTRGSRPVVLACALGQDANLEVLKRVAHSVLRVAERPAGARLEVRLWPRAVLTWCSPSSGAAQDGPATQGVPTGIRIEP